MSGPGPVRAQSAQVIDAHQHFWRYRPEEYPWMTEEQGVLKRDRLPADLAPLMAAAGVTGTVAVQARRMLRETEWLLEVAAEASYVLGVVGWFDLASPRLEHDLERLAKDARLVGARELIHDMPSPAYAASPAHVRGVRAVGRAGLAYDLLLRPEHLRPATRLVDLLPDQRFVVDHLAKPRVASGVLEPWASDLRELATRGNVYCKLSGLVTEADWHAWRPEDLIPYLEVALEAFGAERVMLGSDWPVCACAADYPTTIGLVRGMVAGLGEHEQAAVLGGNARRFYRLP